MLDWELGRLKSSTFLKGICVVGLWKLLTEAAEMVLECGPRTMPEACHLSCVSHFTCLCPHPCSLNLSGARFFPPLKADSQGRWREQVSAALPLPRVTFLMTHQDGAHGPSWHPGPARTVSLGWEPPANSFLVLLIRGGSFWQC